MEIFELISIGLFITGIFPGIYWWYHSRKIKAIGEGVQDQIPISVVIAARNASKDLKSNLPAILNQDYPDFEVIIVDDGSDDDTIDWLKRTRSEHNNLRVISYQKSGPGKKEALSHGISQSRNDIILVTDADCRPASKKWISTMQASLGGKSQITFGYGPYRKIIGLLNKFIRYDTVTIAVQYLSAACQGHPYMGVGRNMIYHKNIFTDNGGFENHKDIASGDDDLFIQGLPDKIKVSVCVKPESLVYSEPKKSWAAFLSQKSRHITTSVRYKRRDQIFLSIYPIVHILFYALLIIAICINPTLGFGFYIFRVLLLMVSLRQILILLKEQDLIPWLGLIDILLVPYYFILSIYSLIRKKNKW